AIIVLALTQAMNLVFVPAFGHAGLALSVSLGAVINAAWLFIGLRRGGWYRPAPGWPRFAAAVALATLVLAAWLAAAATGIDWIGLAGHDGLRAALMGASLFGAALLYFAALFVAGLRPRDFSRRA
ncbi:MAG: lipid II flippase MurJ, partial [Caldimonas sp.]